MIEVFDNFLDSESYQHMQRALTDDKFPWNFNQTIINSREEKTTGQFTHVLYKPNFGIDSQWFKFFVPSLGNKLCGNKMRVLLSAKMNLNPRRSENSILGNFHTDWDIPGGSHKTAIYYYNTNNGFTKFETGETVESVANRVVVFDGSIKHVGHACTDEQARVIINLNYLLL